MKKICFTFLLLLISFSWAAQKATEADDNYVIQNIDGLLTKAEGDILEAIRTEKIKDRVAITDVKIFDYRRDFQHKVKLYVAKSLEGIYDPNRYFRFVSSPKSLNRARVEGGQISSGFDEDLTEMAGFAKEIDTDGFALIDLVIEGKRMKLVITVRRITDNQIVWKGTWERVNQEKSLFLQIGFNMGGSFNLVHFPLYLSFLTAKRAYRFFEWGFYFDLGFAFFTVDNSKIRKQYTIYGSTGFKVGLEIIELAKVSYFGMEFLITLRSGLSISHILSSEIPIVKEMNFGHVIAPGFTFIFDRDYVINLEFDVAFDLGFYFGASYRL